MTVSKREKLLRGILKIIFIIYFLLLMRFTIFKYAAITEPLKAFFLRSREYNIVPLKATLQMIRGLSPIRLIENLAGNIILFVPFGILLPLAFKARGKTILFGFLVSCFIEAMQFAFAMGAADVDDIILNTLGAVIGYLIYIIAKHIFKDQTVLLTVSAAVLGAGLAAGIFILYIAGYLVEGFPNITFY
ncbi:MAG: VanZ family protein [Oscillospiraceae bacterium]|nr:VanZ family protein [Oscillospiraceae bacterium]